jgi:hypothetical protein
MSHGKGGKKRKRGGGGPDRPAVVLVVIPAPTGRKRQTLWRSVHGAAITTIALLLSVAGAMGYLTNTSSVHQLIARHVHPEKIAVRTSVASGVNHHLVAFATLGHGGMTPSRAPVNFTTCTSRRGVTWYDNSAGRGGCLGPGENRQFSCGAWNYSAPGRGNFRSWDGSVEVDVAWIADDGNGACEIGFA